MRKRVIDFKRTGAKIKSLMEEKELSVKNIADTVKVSEATVYYWIKGEKKPSLAHIVNLSSIFDVSIEDLLVIESKTSKPL